MNRSGISVQQAALLLLGISVFMVRALIRQRRLAYYKIGRRIILDAADLEAYLLRHRKVVPAWFPLTAVHADRSACPPITMIRHRATLRRRSCPYVMTDRDS